MLLSTFISQEGKVLGLRPAAIRGAPVSLILLMALAGGLIVLLDC